jgi:putative transposase
LTGRKRVQLCDKGGNFVDALVTKANTDERTCAWMLLLQLRKSGMAQGIQVLFADAGFDGEEFETAVKEEFGHRIEVVRREPDQKGFVVLPSRWLIEQLFGCQGRYRRLSRDYEGNLDIARATIQGANIHRWLRKLKPAPSTEPPFRYRKSL